MIEKVGVIGAGQMGSGIAHVMAQTGIDVTLVDVNPQQLEKALATIRKNMDRQVAKGVIQAADVDAALGRIKTSTAMADLGDRDLVIEAATENEKVKVAIFKDLVPHLKADAMIASNTSSISITRLAAATDRPDKFIGMHFMNPVPIMKLVEVIPGIATAKATLESVRNLAEKVGKTPVSYEL